MSFKYEGRFPYEAFVQKCVEEYFLGQKGFERFSLGHVDLACRDKQTGDTWIIEAKGKTSSIGLDFRTGLGQVVMSITSPEFKYGLAVPDIPQFIDQCGKISPVVRQGLRLHFVLVDSNRNVKIIGPQDLLE